MDTWPWETGLKTGNSAVAGRELRSRSGFLHCAAHDETVSDFGRNDDFLGVCRKKTAAEATECYWRGRGAK
jgi:hypothetical protein